MDNLCKEHIQVNGIGVPMFHPKARFSALKEWAEVNGFDLKERTKEDGGFIFLGITHYEGV